MKRIIVGCTGVAAVATAWIGTAGAASAAPDVIGQKYADALKAIEDGGGTAIVSTRVGSRLDQDECIVTGATDSPFVHATYPDGDSGFFEHATDTVLVSLNCNGGVASVANPGNSIASQAGRQAMEAQQNAENSEQAGIASVDQPNG